MYDKVSTDLNFAAREPAVSTFWQENDTMRESWRRRSNGPIYTVYDGPPTANGKPHIGHLLTRSIKDIIPRYRTMKGYHVTFKAGWDTHGLPVELEVERSLGINSKPEIEAYGIEAFVQKCKESVWTYKDEWEQMSDRVGYWSDMDDPYITYDNDYIESEWWALKEIWKKGLLYEGYKIQPYCPRCGTTLSSHEVAQGYKDVTDTSAFVRFAVTGEPDTYFAAWTTTPWTLPSNVALCVNPAADYALVSREEDGRTIRYYIAADLAEETLGEAITVHDKMTGRTLEHKHYVPLLPYANRTVEQSGKDAFFVTCDDYVTLADGTGVVHIAPAFGEDDYRIGQRYDLPFVQLVETDGTMSADVTDFSGQFVKDADPGILDKLKADGLLLYTVPVEHTYPFCWRCDTPLLYYARHSWFIRMTAVRDQLMANNQTVNWLPENVRDGRFGNFLENVIDWGLSRDRYWGTPLPAWQCASGHIHVVGSISELKSMSTDCPEDIELHKPYIDQVHITCPECGGEMTRVPEVIDGWFDSGAMPFAQYHYPFENQEAFADHFPADFISEGVDQTRGWFYSLMAISTVLFEQSSYKNVIVLGLVQDKDGIKMSKHKGNVVDPWEALNKQGADAIRWYFYTGSQPWLPSRYSDEAVSEAQRKFMGTLWNTYAFYILYANIDDFSPADYTLDYTRLGVMDRWILARLNTTVRLVDTGLEKYDVTSTGRALTKFVDELSNWYVRRSRERFWAGDMEQDKINAYMTLYTVLKTVILLAAPYVPFITETIYQNLVRKSEQDAPESVHFCDYPVFREEWSDSGLESGMDLVLRIVTEGRAARNISGLKNRQPLSRILVQTDERLGSEFEELVLDELNCKRLEYITDAGELMDYVFKPQLRTMGKRFGKRLPALQDVLAGLDGRAAWQTLQQKGFITVTVEGTEEELREEDLIIETSQLEGFATEEGYGVTVSLDLKLTPELIEEGYVREVISKLQTMRRDNDFEVTDRVTVGYRTTPELSGMIARNRAAISEVVLVNDIYELAAEEEAREWDINGTACWFKVGLDA